MKTILLILALGLLCLAGEPPLGQRVMTINHHVVIPTDGSLEEICALTNEWVNAVMRKNPNFSDIRVLVSEVKERECDIFVLYTHAKEPPGDTNGINTKLIEQHWGDQERFKAFMAKMQRYINRSQNQRRFFNELLTPEKVEGQ